MKFAIFVGLCTVIPLACGDLFGVDETLYNQLRAKKTSNEIATEFMENLFPKLIGDIFESGIVLPPMEVDLDMSDEEIDEEEYMCATETQMSITDLTLRKGESGSTGWSAIDDSSTDRISISVDVNVKYSELQFELAQNNKGSIVPKTKVRYDFQGENVIRFAFSIPNFPEKDVKDPKCLVQMWHLTVIRLGSPRLLNEDEIKQLGEKHVEMVEEYSKKIVEESTILIGVGMLKALTEKLRGNNSWRCVTRALLETEREDEKEYMRKENNFYKKYCGGGNTPS